MKHFKKILATVLIAGSVISVAGCSSGTVYSSTSTSANWNVATSATVEGNYKEFWRSHKEVATYSVDFKEGGNTSYKVEYNTADAGTKYTTSFYMDKNDYDWGASTLPDGVKISSDNAAAPKDAVYVYETEYTVKGRYVLSATNETVEFSNSVTTVCKYRLAGEGLKPVYSHQVIKSTAPNTLTAVSKDSMCVTIDATYETFYNRECNKAVIKTTDNTNSDKSGEKTVTLEGLVFDNSQLAFALRSFSLSGTKSFNVCSPQNGNAQGLTATCATAAALNSEDATDKEVIKVLNNVTDGNGNKVEDYIFFDGTSSDPDTAAKQIRYHNVSIALTANMKGSNNVYSYAAVENADVNTTRSVLLKMTTPVAFGLGTLSYTIKNLSLVSF
ncbi:MAG: hypothetical protein ACI4MQ_05395 [Candidatus Coproplasma sp.]